MALARTLAPAFHLAQERLVDAFDAADALALDPFAQGSAGDGFAAETGFELVPFFDVILTAQVLQPGRAGRVAAFGFDAAIVDAELFKVGQDADRLIARPAITPQLIGGQAVLLEVDMRRFGLDEELRRPADAEAIIRALRPIDAAFSHHDADFMPDLAIVGHIPAERAEERIDELPPQLGLVGWLAPLKTLDQLVDAFWRAHGLPFRARCYSVRPRQT